MNGIKGLQDHLPGISASERPEGKDRRQIRKLGQAISIAGSRQKRVKREGPGLGGWQGSSDTTQLLAKPIKPEAIAARGDKGGAGGTRRTM
jgi:hypothetical protein